MKRKFNFILNRFNLKIHCLIARIRLFVVPAVCGKIAILYDTEKIPAWSDGDYKSCDTSKYI